MVSTINDPTCTRCGHARSLHKHVERPDIWWCAGNGMGAGRCTCPVFTDQVPEPFEPDEYDEGEAEETPFELSFVFVNRGESIVWSRADTLYLTRSARSVELNANQPPNGCISIEQRSEIRDYRLDCVIDDGALSGRQAAWVAVLAGLRFIPNVDDEPRGGAAGHTFAQGELCNVCSVPLDTLDEDVDADRMFHAHDTLYKGDLGLLLSTGQRYSLTLHFDPSTLKADEQIPIGFIRVVVSGMLIAE